MYKFEKINNTLLGDRVEEGLMRYILEKPVEIGQKIPSEFTLAEHFGVGRSTIREAVKSLVSKGILEVRRGSGTFVTSTSMPADDPLGLSRFQDKYKLALDLFDIRLMIEPEIAAHAAEYSTSEDRKELERLCNETETLYKNGQDHIPKDIEFHSFIARCSNNQVVEMLVPIIHTAVITFADMTNRTLMNETIETHRAIVNAINDQDSVGARCAMIMHLTYNRQALIRLLKEE